jgi:hypothetical protein
MDDSRGPTAKSIIIRHSILLRVHHRPVNQIGVLPPGDSTTTARSGTVIVVLGSTRRQVQYRDGLLAQH